VTVYEIAVQLQQDLIESSEKTCDEYERAPNRSLFQKSWALFGYEFTAKNFKGWPQERLRNESFILFATKIGIRIPKVTNRGAQACRKNFNRRFLYR